MYYKDIPRINFVIEGIDEILHSIMDFKYQSVDELYPFLKSGRTIWTLQTYWQLKKYYENELKMKIGCNLDSDYINILHRDDLRLKKLEPGKFIVGIRADRPPLLYADLVVVQNNTLAKISDDRTYFINHWPQPMLQPRNPDRQLKSNVAFVGQKSYVPSALKAKKFQERLQAEGFKAIFPDVYHADFREIDFVVAIRESSGRKIVTKPASKLINAWLTGIPAIVNPEVGYLELQRGPEDFILAETDDELITALISLRNDPTLYEAMVSNGYGRGIQFDVEATAERWFVFLRDVAWPKFKATQPILSSKRRRLLVYSRYAAQKIASMYFAHQRKL